MENKRVLAFDLGASGGRAILGVLNNNSIEYKEIHRFSNDPVRVKGTLYWDILRLFHEIKTGITKAMNEGGFDSIGIDTWGVDFGLLDREGNLLENPVHYRDERTLGITEELYSKVPREEIYGQTGIQTIHFNTIFQLYYLTYYRKELMERVSRILLIPDLLAYFLTGVMKAEYSIASTTQMLDPKNGSWIYDSLEQLGIRTGILPDIINSGDIYGELSDAICGELGCDSVPVIAVCAHDTASAVVSVPANYEDFIYISCGTWSLLGTEIKEPVINQRALEFNLTNESGFNRSIRFLKNIMGLWLIQESRRQWLREGLDYSYADLENMALAAKPFKCFIDPDAPEFEAPGNLPKRVIQYCRWTGQEVPSGAGEIMRCIYESLGMKYRYTMGLIESCTGRAYDIIHLIGGGVKDRLLCQMTADFCGKRVLAGPAEATGIGNMAVQMIALGEIDGLKSAREIIGNTCKPICYEPNGNGEIDGAFKRFLDVILYNK